MASFALIVALVGCQQEPDLVEQDVVPKSGVYQLHPYFGYTYATSRDGVNRHGFQAGGREYPYRASPGEFVVGIFGGSAAVQVARHPDGLAKALLPGLRSKGYNRVTVLPFAVEGWRQPQPFNAFVRYLPDIDMAILIDGVSEIVEFADDDVPGWPGDYPAARIYGVLAGQREGPSAESPSERAEEYFSGWEDRIRLMDLIGLERSKPVLHFVQPNPFTGGEDARRLGAVAASAYDRMREMTERLSATGTASHLVDDLLQEKNGGRDVYAEACCDLSRGGAAAVTEAVAAEVERSAQMEEVVPATERVRAPRGPERGGRPFLPLLGSLQ